MGWAVRGIRSIKEKVLAKSVGVSHLINRRRAECLPSIQFRRHAREIQSKAPIIYLHSVYDSAGEVP